ncbi:hypothetical protein LSAT2_018277 [Lamellibrachia satsuma]|nr:hypothetical protein LSAT2_018277 [Lamellibrachia satsuma]
MLRLKDACDPQRRARNTPGVRSSWARDGTDRRLTANQRSSRIESAVNSVSIRTVTITRRPASDGEWKRDNNEAALIKDVARETVQSTAMYYDKLNVHMWIATGLLSLTADCATALRYRRRSDEELLLEYLFRDYNPSARPVLNSSQTVSVNVQFSLLQIQELNIRSQVLTTTGLLILVSTETNSICSLSLF